ncbi:MAG: type II secretion system F family protein [Pseudohongiella sp.]|uniref:type II secretion system F family protein n=1 Tax=Pseudohongiella sp. TaxID=1979412 RepID=UPI0034A073CE
MAALLASPVTFIVMVLVVLAIGLVVAAVYQIFGSNANHEKVLRRLENLTAAPESNVPDKDKQPGFEKDGAFMVRVLEPVGGLILPKEDWQKSGMQKKLVHAGYRSAKAIVVLLGAKVLIGLALPIVTGALWSLYGSADYPMGSPVSLAALILTSLIGFILPDYILQKRINTRRLKMTEGFPDALDMLVVCVEAGLGLDAAISRVSAELRLSHPELANELELNSLETRAGKSRDEALKALSERMGVEEVQAMVTLLIQADKFGTSVGTALRSYAEEMRIKRIQRAREKAAKLPVKMLFPVMVFIFPALFLVILGPAVVSISNTLVGAF